MPLKTIRVVYLNTKKMAQCSHKSTLGRKSKYETFQIMRAKNWPGSSPMS